MDLPESERAVHDFMSGGGDGEGIVYGTMMLDTRIAGFASITSSNMGFWAGASDFRGKVEAVHVLCV
jgi:hypothetical protein